MGRKFAVFDIDGTLIRWQLYHAIVDELADNGTLGKDAKQRLHKARMTWKNREHSNAFAEYEHKLVAIYESSLDTFSPAEFDEMVNAVIDKYKDQVYTYTRDLVKRLKQEGYFLLAISGSHHELVERLAKYYGFDDWVGTRYERVGQEFSGKIFVASRDKGKALDEFMQKHGLISKDSWAIGDSQSDAAMLERADNPIAFNPDQKLYMTAKTNGWQIVIERKNVVYNLTKTNDDYTLA